MVRRRKKRNRQKVNPALGAKLKAKRIFMMLIGLVAGGVTIVCLFLLFSYGIWKDDVHKNMPPEVKEILSYVDEDSCSSQNCSACNAKQCRKHRGSCSVQKLSWNTKEKTYKIDYCISLNPH